MPTLRNFEQLLIVKQLYEDAVLLTDRGDVFSLSKAVLFLDLSIETTLKAILINLNPNYLTQFFQQKQLKTSQKQGFDVSWHVAWEQASNELEKKNRPALSEESESRNLRSLRNGIQHNGQTPTIQDTKRYLISTQKMLRDAFLSAFDLDFENLRSWDFIQNKDLKQLLIESEDFLTQKDVLSCIIGCLRALNLILGAILYKTKSYTLSSRHDFSFPNEFRKFESNLKSFLNDYNKLLIKNFDNMESELLLVGMGMLITDTRRFLSYKKILSDGQDPPSIRIKGGFTEQTFKEDFSEAEFMLNYLLKLIRFIEDNQPEILENIHIKVSRSQQKSLNK
jgi:hypothetical protein